LSVNGYFPLFPLVVTERIILKGCDRLVHISHSFHEVDHIHNRVSRLAYVLTEHVSQTRPTGRLTFSFSIPGGSGSGLGPAPGPAAGSDLGTISVPSSAPVPAQSEAQFLCRPTSHSPTMLPPFSPRDKWRDVTRSSGKNWLEVTFAENEKALCLLSGGYFVVLKSLVTTRRSNNTYAVNGAGWLWDEISSFY